MFHFSIPNFPSFPSFPHSSPSLPSLLLVSSLCHTILTPSHSPYYPSHAHCSHSHSISTLTAFHIDASRLSLSRSLSQGPFPQGARQLLRSAESPQFSLTPVGAEITQSLIGSSQGLAELALLSPRILGAQPMCHGENHIAIK